MSSFFDSLLSPTLKPVLKYVCWRLEWLPLSYSVLSPILRQRATLEDTEDHYTYLCLIVFSLPVLLVWLLKTIYYTYLCLIVYSLPVLLAWLLKTTKHTFVLYSTLSPCYWYGCWRLYTYIPLSCSLLSPRVTVMAGKDYILYIPLSYSLLSPRVTGMAAEDCILYIVLSCSLHSPRVTSIDAEDYTTHTFFV